MQPRLWLLASTVTTFEDLVTVGDDAACSQLRRETQVTRRLSRADEAALIWLSGGSCYWPGCGEPAISIVNGKPRMRLQVAHIRAAEDGGPRFDEEMSESEREAWLNKMLMCQPHHTEIDQEWQNYPIETLDQWKSQREADARGQLSGLRNLTESRLQEMMTVAIAESQKRIDETVARLERTDAEAAGVIRDLLDQLNDVRRHGSLLNSDTIGVLSSAARSLANLRDDAVMLGSVAYSLRNLGENARTLDRAAHLLGGLGDKVNALSEAVYKLSGLSGMIDSLYAAVSELRRHGR